MPLYPAIAILIARAIRDGALSQTRWLRRGTLWWPLIAIVIPVGSVVALIAMRHQLGLLAWPVGAGAMVLGFMAWRYFDADGPEKSLARGVGGEVLLEIAFFVLVGLPLQ